MASKMEYLQRYLQKPSDTGIASEARHKKEKKKGGKSAADRATFSIRDVSEVLPQQRLERKPQKMRPERLGLESLEQGENDLVYVDEEAVTQAQKVDAETSGVAWRIQQHSKKGLRRPSVKEEIKEEVKEEERSDAASDFSPPRAKAQPNRDPPMVAQARTQREQGADSDLSPPRGAAAQRGADSDMSPPREQGCSGPPIKKEETSDADLSPPRHAAVGSQGAVASTRRRHDADSDLSPPRAGEAKTTVRREEPAADFSPPRNGARPQRHDSDVDLSPPRKSQRTEERPSGDVSPATARRNRIAAPPQQRRRHDSDSDLSPPRPDIKQETHVKLEADDANDVPAPRRQRHDSDADMSPPRREQQPVERASNQRQRHDSDADLSPPRNNNQRQRHDSDADLSPPRKTDEPQMTSGLRIGLVSGQDLKNDAAKVRAERRASVDAAPDEETGRVATTVYRDKATGKKITREEFVEQSKKKKKKRLSDYPEQELEWGGGVKQQASEEENKAEVARIAAQPFARYEPDERYAEELQAKQNWNDPMRNYKQGDDALGPEVSADGKTKRPKCPHTPWMNRFGILPGYRWDGKIRGNDFERKWLETKNQRVFEKEDRWRNAQDDDG